MTPDSFAKLVAALTSRIEGRPLDAQLESDLNALFPPQSREYVDLFDACREAIRVSPIEVEAALLSHPAVLEAAVIGKEDTGQLVKPLAFVVLNADFPATDSLADDLKQYVKSRLAPYKYPRWIQFVPALPKTVTGKIQRFKLRALAATVADAAALH
jgi:AMP-binding enzyme C-terminal domain